MEAREILFITATHGDEQDSVRVMEELERKLPKDEYGYDWIIGNERAYKLNQRFVEKDLNRCAPGDIDSSVYEERRAAEIMEISKKYSKVIDIHGTKTDSGIVTIIPYPTLANIALAKELDLRRNVVWHSESSRFSGPIAQHVPIPAIELECGPKGTKGALDLIYGTVHKFLTADKANAPTSTSSEFYNVYGKLYGRHDAALRDFVLAREAGESFYPFLSGNDYPGITCYKMNLISDDYLPIVNG